MNQLKKFIRHDDRKPKSKMYVFTGIIMKGYRYMAKAMCNKGCGGRGYFGTVNPNGKENSTLIACKCLIKTKFDVYFVVRG